MMTTMSPRLMPRPVPPVVARWARALDAWTPGEAGHVPSHVAARPLLEVCL